jgi:hypothetical protein
MRRASTPSIVLNGDQTVYLVLGCFGRNGCVWREADSDRTDHESVITDLMAGQYNDPSRVIAFNNAEHWSQDVSEDVALEIERRADLADDDVSSTLDGFMERIRCHDHQLTSRLASS